MEAATETPWIEHLSTTECWVLVASVEVGRLGVIVDSAPEIYPVNHLVDSDSVVFRTAEGTKLRGLERTPLACFEADHTDIPSKTGWSVLVKGRAVEITDADELRTVRSLARSLWALGEKAHWIRIVPNEITGRRLGRTAGNTARR